MFPTELDKENPDSPAYLISHVEKIGVDSGFACNE